jgi:hypothetical protein
MIWARRREFCFVPFKLLFRDGGLVNGSIPSFHVPVTQTDRSCAREVRVGELPALNDHAARKFEDGVGPCVARACADRISDFGLIQAAFRGTSANLARISAKSRPIAPVA